MSLPPCHPQFPGLPTLRRRHGPQYELSRGHRASGLQLNLTWLMNLLEKIPGPHQQRIPSQSRQQTLQAAVTTDGLPHDGVQQGGGISKEELGRGTWTFLHTLAAQWPQQPTRQQQKDLTSLVDVLTRIYPCAECAKHFKGVVRENPPRSQSQPQLEQWLCEVHNSVNDSLGKPRFNCRAAGLRWPAIECNREEACALQGAPPSRKGH